MALRQYSLFVNHQLNYDETVRRLAYWATVDTDYALSMIRTLVKLLERDRNCLYFEAQV